SMLASVLHSSSPPRALPSFPTRRSSDLGASLPSTCTSMFFAFLASSVWVASTCSTSEVPMPCASAPKAPCVEVCESPQTTEVERSEEHTSELQSLAYLVCRLLLEKKK